MMEQVHDPEQQIAERYFLGELDDAQAEAFEAHYFECPSCAEYVRETQMLLEGGRQVVRTPGPVPFPLPIPTPVHPSDNVHRPRIWQPWMANAAAAMLAFVVGGQAYLSKRPTSDIVHPQTLQTSSSRAETPEVRWFPVGVPVSIDVPVVPPEESFRRYELFTRNKGTGKEIKRHELTREALNDNISLVLDHLPVGRYEVVIEGVREDGKRSPIAASPFEVRGQQKGESP
jgi:hypothetical protein